MERELSSSALVALAVLCALTLACGARTIHWNVSDAADGWATIYIEQKEPTFNVLAIDGVTDYPTADGSRLPLGADFRRLEIRVRPGVYEVTLICRYQTGHRFRYTSFGRLSTDSYAEREVTRGVAVGPGTWKELNSDTVCPENPPCEADECDDASEFRDLEPAPTKR